VARKSTNLSRAARGAWALARRMAVLIGWRRAGLGVLVVLGPVVALNGLVAWCGSTVVFPLSPFFLRAKASALARYAAHRPQCLAADHPPIGPVIARAEARHRLPRGLLAALVQVESEGRPHRISPTGAMGPGQLMPSTARALGVDDPFDTAENVDASARYLAQQLAHFHDIRLAVAAYNAGPGAVTASHGIPHNGETEIYVERVLRLRRVATAPMVARGQPPEARAFPARGAGPMKEPSLAPSPAPLPRPRLRPRAEREADPGPQAAARRRPDRAGTGQHLPARHRSKHRIARLEAEEARRATRVE
jgi:hypothetical protein